MFHICMAAHLLLKRITFSIYIPPLRLRKFLILVLTAFMAGTSAAIYPLAKKINAIFS